MEGGCRDDSVIGQKGLVTANRHGFCHSAMCKRMPKRLKYVFDSIRFFLGFLCSKLSVESRIRAEKHLAHHNE